MKNILIIVLLAISAVLPALAQNQTEQALIESATTQFRVQSLQENWQQAESAAQQAYDLGLSLYTDSDPLFGPLAYSLGTARVAMKKPSALIPLTQALKNYERNVGDKSAKLIPILMDLASAHILSGDVVTAKNQIDRTLKLAAIEYGKGSTMLARLNSRAGQELRGIGNYEQASKFYQRTYDIYEGMFGPNSSKTGEAAFQLAELAKLDGNLRAELSFLKKTLKSFDQPETVNSEFERTVNLKLIAAYHGLGKPKKATAHVLALASGQAESDLLEPELVVKPDASYQARNRYSELEGYVTIGFDVDSEGYVRNTRLIEFEGGRKLVNLAMAALDGYRYIPAVRDGQPVTTADMETKIVFRWDT